MYERRDKIQSYHKIEDREREILDALYFPFTNDFDLSFIRFTDACSVTSEEHELRLMSGYGVKIYPNFYIPKVELAKP